MFLTYIYVFISNYDANIANLGIHCLLGDTCEMSVAANVDKRKIDISKTQRLIVTDLCYTRTSK